jgi:NAD(P)-dependent dehydrogenase (short-subunit alcohol dehydrogenase family)
LDLELTGKTAIITGGNRGIGRSVAMELAREGVDVFLTARDADELSIAARDIAATTGRKVFVQAGDMRDPAMAQILIDAARHKLGRLDILINNAGATKRGDFLDLTDDDWHDGFALKFHGYSRMARAAWPALVQSEGSIINICGVGSRVGAAEFSIGGSVNVALLNLTKALADKGRTEGIRVNAVNPGRIVTDRLTRNHERMAKLQSVSVDEAARRHLASVGINRFGRPEEIGWLCAYLASQRAAFIHGSVIDIDGGETRAL